MSEVFEDSQIVVKQATTRETIRLGDVIEVIRGASPRPKGDPKYFGGDIPWISISDITREPGKFLSRTREFVTVAGAEKSRLLSAGTLILSNSGTVCVPKILAVDGCIHDGFVAFPNLSAAFDKTYLYWFFEYIRPSIIEANRQGITQVNLNTGIVREIRLPSDSLERQREIVAEIETQFSRLDEAVANLQRVKANLKRYKASVLKDAVEGRLVPLEAELARREGRSLETGGQLLQRILEARRSSWSGRGKFRSPDAPEPNAAELPEGWTWSSIDQLADVGTGATPNRSKVEYWNNGDVPWVTSGVANADYVDKASEFVTQRALAETNLTLYPAGTLLVAMYGEGKTRGKCAELRIPATTNQALAALQVNDQVRAYLRHFLELNYEEMRKVASGGVQPNLNLSLVRAVAVPLPPVAEQNRIVAEVDRRLSLIRGVETEVDANLKRAQALRHSVLSSCFQSKVI